VIEYDFKYTNEKVLRKIKNPNKIQHKNTTTKERKREAHLLKKKKNLQQEKQLILCFF
jgi:hypothetical protein